MRTISRLMAIDVDELSASDLRDEAMELGPYISSAYRFDIIDEATGRVIGDGAQALYASAAGQLGIAWGADADWVDCIDEGAVEAAISQWLNPDGDE